MKKKSKVAPKVVRKGVRQGDVEHDTGWSYLVQRIRVVTIDGVKYTGSVIRKPDQDFLAAVVASGGNSVEEIFADHAHSVLGTFKTEAQAVRVVNKFMRESATRKRKLRI